MEKSFTIEWDKHPLNPGGVEEEHYHLRCDSLNDRQIYELLFARLKELSPSKCWSYGFFQLGRFQNKSVNFYNKEGQTLINLYLTRKRRFPCKWSLHIQFWDRDELTKDDIPNLMNSTKK